MDNIINQTDVPFIILAGITKNLHLVYTFFSNERWDDVSSNYYLQGGIITGVLHQIQTICKRGRVDKRKPYEQILFQALFWDTKLKH